MQQLVRYSTATTMHMSRRQAWRYWYCHCGHGRIALLGMLWPLVALATALFALLTVYTIDLYNKSSPAQSSPSLSLEYSDTQ